MSDSDFEHDSCTCLVTSANYETLCKSKCDDDDDCKGYYYYGNVDIDHFNCIFYSASSSSCPTHDDGCYRNEEGNVGLLVNEPKKDPSNSGCYIKLGNVHKCRIYIMFY